jgi:transposase
MDRLQELVRLHRLGTGAREVARLLRMGPNTEREYRAAIAEAGLLDGRADELPALDELKTAVQRHLAKAPPAQMTSSIAAWEPQIVALAEAGLTPKPIHDRLKLEHADFRGSAYAVRAVWRRWRKARGVRAEDVAIPVEHVVGDVAQVDFGYVGQLYDATVGRLRKAWVFVLVLAHSRWMFARIAFDQTIGTWLRLHAEAFAALGAVPRTVVPDNLKAAVIHAAFGVDQPASLNRSYRELACHYGFKIDPTPIRAPEKKGRVESGVGYVKRNFFAGRHGQDAHEVAVALARWLDEIANVREHGTTRRRPIDVLAAEERGALLPLPARPYEVVLWHQALVHRDGHVAFEHRQYSVPWRLIGRRVWLRASPTSISIYAEEVRVATHDRRGTSPRSTQDEHLPATRAPWRHRSRELWQARADAIAPEVGAYVRELVETDDVLSMLRAVQATVTLLEGVPRERAAAACLRAQHFGARSYAALKNILRQGLDLIPLSTPSPPPPLPRPRFARSMSELLHHDTTTKETDDELN